MANRALIYHLWRFIGKANFHFVLLGSTYWLKEALFFKGTVRILSLCCFKVIPTHSKVVILFFTTFIFQAVHQVFHVA